MKDCKKLATAALLTLAALTAACASSGKIRPQPFPSPASPGSTIAPQPTVPSGPARSSLIDTALSYRGVPYRNGGSDPKGFDCSGFTQWVFAQSGVALPREVEEQFKVGQKIKLDDLKPGDLVFFHTVSRGASHVGIFVADDQFIHAPSSKGVVRVESINSSYWAQRFLGARRLPSSAESTVVSGAAARAGARGYKAAD
jgi:cell wall-associated NlpC family hydrolase